MPTPEQTAIVIVAAGRGLRAGDGAPKQWRDLGGQSVLARTVNAFDGFPRRIVVLHPDDMGLGVAAFGGGVTLIAGGATRAASVRNALDSLTDAGMTHVLIHDGARPFVSPAVVGRVMAALDHADAAAPALAVTDALWAGQDGQVTAARPREGLFRAQTPQGFSFERILAAHRAQGDTAPADDVETALAAGIGVAIVAGEEENFKITWPDD
ncbi:MAG: 2-C-methyl-D-erythritol 4-phosphate cytidylyltransferase, partial [Rhodobacteraceae bacterium]|nr:2-C-methyl-D-erythritol 4-phosphate cytidylyltransferase [Paracoccaceae bacterium]